MYGADFGLGVCVAFVITFLFGVQFNASAILTGVLFAYAPDIDWAFDQNFWKKGYVAAYAQNPYDHREGLHKPLLWFALISTWGLMMGGGVLPLIAFCAVALHFLHDTVGTGWGVPWAWPITLRRFKLFAHANNDLGARLWVSWSHRELPEYITKYGRAEWQKHFYTSWNIVSVTEYLVTLLGASLLIAGLLM
jgi:hypothetical protein